MKLLICSDIHGSLRAALYIKSLIETGEFDKLILLGDNLYNGARNPVESDYAPYKIVPILNEFKDKIIAVKGNCESDVDLLVLEFEMPRFSGFKINDKTFYLTHGDIKEYDIDDKIQNNEYLLKGHTHIPFLIHNKNNGIILNPGSMTFPKGCIDKSFMIIDDEDVTLYEFDYDKYDNVFIKNKYNLKDGDKIFDKEVDIYEG